MPTGWSPGQRRRYWRRGLLCAALQHTVGLQLEGVHRALSGGAYPTTCCIKIQRLVTPHMPRGYLSCCTGRTVSVTPRPCDLPCRSLQAVPLPVSQYPWRAGTRSIRPSRCLISTWRSCSPAHCCWACQWVRERQSMAVVPTRRQRSAASRPIGLNNAVHWLATFVNVLTTGCTATG